MREMSAHQLPITARTNQGSNSFSHMIYVMQTCTYQNTVKLFESHLYQIFDNIS